MPRETSMAAPVSFIRWFGFEYLRFLLSLCSEANNHPDPFDQSQRSEDQELLAGDLAFLIKSNYNGPILARPLPFPAWVVKARHTLPCSVGCVIDNLSFAGALFAIRYVISRGSEHRADVSDGHSKSNLIIGILIDSIFWQQPECCRGNSNEQKCHAQPRQFALHGVSPWLGIQPNAHAQQRPHAGYTG
jgi:hypothetical protein